MLRCYLKFLAAGKQNVWGIVVRRVIFHYENNWKSGLDCNIGSKSCGSSEDAKFNNQQLTLHVIWIWYINVIIWTPQWWIEPLCAILHTLRPFILLMYPLVAHCHCQELYYRDWLKWWSCMLVLSQSTVRVQTWKDGWGPHVQPLSILIWRLLRKRVMPAY